MSVDLPAPRTIAFKAGERNVFFHILTACNLRCSHCYINPEQHGRETLDKETVLKWLQIFAEDKLKTNLILLGGEPTLHPDLAEIVARAKEMGFSTTVDSNGYLHHDFLQKTSPAELDYLSFSLDGPTAEINDPIRGQGVFETCVQGVKDALALGHRVSLIYTVSGKNIEYLHLMPALLKELGVQKFFIQVIGLRGESAKSPDSLQVDRQRWFEVVPEVARQVAALGISVTWPKVYLAEDEPFECAGNVAENYFIFPNGRVYQCPLCEDHPIHSLEIVDDQLVTRDGLGEKQFFDLNIAEGCVMNKLLQGDNISYRDGLVENKISCCMLKQEL